MNAVIQIEKTVLGACLLEDEIALDVVTSSIAPEHFFTESYRGIYRVIAGLYFQQKPVNLVTVMQELGLALQGVGGASAIASLTEDLPRMLGARVQEYVDRLKEFDRRRRMGMLGEELAAAADDASVTSQSLIALTQDRLEALVDDGGPNFSGVADMTSDILNRFETDRSMTTSPGMSYGVAELDALTGGIMPGFQVVLGARSGVGKTTLMAQAIAANCAAGLSVDAFLLEPTRDDLLRKLWSIISGVDYGHLTRPWTCSESDAWKIRKAAGEVADWNLRIHDRSGLTLDQILGLARIGMHRYDSRLICVDYLQRVKIKSQDAKEDIRLKIGRASTSFADLVKKTKTATLLLSQLSRRGTVESIPNIQDLRESGQIENDAHTIVLLHLEYDADNGHYKREGAILVPKHRFGLPCNLQARLDAHMAVWTVDAPNHQHQAHWQEKN